MTAAATTGPASGPRPASSQPATGHTPRLSAERSRRKVGRTISSSSGRRAACGCVATHGRHDDHAAARSATRTRSAAELRGCRRSCRDGRSEQIELLRARPRRAEMLGGDLVLGGVEAEPFAGDFEAAADHPGDRAGSGLPLAERRIVVLAAARVADELEDVVVAVGKILISHSRNRSRTSSGSRSST